MIHLIAAIDRRGGIGNRGDLLYHISADLRRFKSLTLGNVIVMGRKTFESLPKGALPGRRNIVVSGNKEFQAHGAETALTVEQALEMAKSGPGDTFVVGGASIYRQTLPMAEILDITIVHDKAPESDTVFPTIELDNFEVVNDSGRCHGEPSYSFITLRRK